jgi:hypothetical protein
VKLPALAFTALLVASAGVSPALAHAVLDPSTAESDTRAILKSDAYSFCTRPDHPLSHHARELCPLAGEIPGCGPLVTECDRVPTPPPRPSPFWEHLARFLVRAAPYVAWTAVILLAALVVYLVVRALRAARGDAPQAEAEATQDVTLVPDAPPPEEMTPAEALLRRAAEARARGDHRTALLTYLAAALRALDDRGAIRLARDRTNGEYLRSCQEPAARPGLRDLVRDVDGVQFGGRAATPEAVSLAQGRAEHIVRTLRSDAARLVAGAATTLAIVLLLGACGGVGGSRGNPAGRDLLVDLLVKQGAVVSSLPGSLANLPMNGAAGPVVILDAERVPLEDETRDHLVAWVKQGGTLVLAGSPSLWPADFWAKPLAPSTCTPGLTKIRVETRSAAPPEDDDDDDAADSPNPAASVNHAMIARRTAMTWPYEDRTPRTIARLEDGELYGALRVFGAGKVLGLASTDLLTNLGLAVPGNAASLVAMLATLERQEFAVARAEQGISPPTNPFAGLLHVGLGPALLHALFFVPLLFLAYGVRQAAPRPEPPPERRAFAEHVRAVGALYARRRSASHALAAYARHVDDRLRARMPRGHDPVQFLSDRSGADPAETAALYARAMSAKVGQPLRGDELAVLQRLSVLYARAMARG